MLLARAKKKFAQRRSCRGACGTSLLEDSSSSSSSSSFGEFFIGEVKGSEADCFDER